MSQLWISAASMFVRGWGFKAVECDITDPDAVCPMANDPLRWIKAKDKAMFNAWCIAGKPQDAESLRFYGAMPASDGDK